RLAHPLEDDAVDALALHALAFQQRPIDEANLLDDLPRLEVAPEAEAPRRAEHAPECASDLGAHADGEAPGSLERDANGLDPLAVAEGEDELPEGIDRAPLLGDDGE